ncbi:MAG: hypothetical protein FRX49_05361 [Trebouxia sp. A1-2]|nr:MAG: hypothetical protein FRX49_05361 [Trebouxia sp. A1-2]
MSGATSLLVSALSCCSRVLPDFTLPKASSFKSSTMWSIFKHLLYASPGDQSLPSLVGLKRMPSPALHWPIFHKSELVMVAGHTKPPRLGPSNIKATGISPAAQA